MVGSGFWLLPSWLVRLALSAGRAQWRPRARSGVRSHNLDVVRKVG